MEEQEVENAENIQTMFAEHAAAWETEDLPQVICRCDYSRIIVMQLKTTPTK